MKPQYRFAAAAAMAILFPLTSLAEPTPNQWPVFRNLEFGFRISYPPDWRLLPTKGPNVRFSVSPANGSGNCNVVARRRSDIAGMSQQQLDEELRVFDISRDSWASILGLPASDIHLMSSRRAAIYRTPAVLATVESRLENLGGAYTRVQMVALAMTPGVVWSLNCGASLMDAAAARRRFAELEPAFKDVFASFNFIR